MNKVYKSIWNAVTRSWTAVSEWQSSRGKQSTKSKKSLAVTLALAISLGVTSQFAFAENYGGGIFSPDTIRLDKPIYIGNNNQAGILQEHDTQISNLFGIPVNISFQTTNVDINNLDPFKQSTHGFRQIILKSDSLSDLTVGSIHDMFENMSQYNKITQGITQNGSSNPVAYFDYASGERVYKLVRFHQLVEVQ